MSGCGCEETRANLEELIRGELCTTDSASIREHLASCDECRDEQQVFEKLTVAVRRACESAAPPSLREAVLSGLSRLHDGAGGPSSPA